MIIVPLARVPNQTFSITLDSNQYNIGVFTTRSTMAIDITRNNEIVIQGQRLVPDSIVIPYRYLEDGNFFILTENGEYPFYTEFGVSQTLLYASTAELEELRTQNG